MNVTVMSHTLTSDSELLCATILIILLVVRQHLKGNHHKEVTVKKYPLVQRICNLL
jgi:hypothetical protein